jgi:coenzyme PQQ biosynthesis protein PqqD
MASSEQICMDNVRLERRPVRKPDYRLEQLDDELLLYHPNENQIIYLNQTASLVWVLCDGNRSVEEIIQLLGQAYPAEASISTDVLHILGRFHQANCIELN